MKAWKWVALGCASVPAIFLGSKIEWGFHEESGPGMAGDFLSWKFPQGRPNEGRAFAQDVCGEPVDFSQWNSHSYWDAMAELPVARHFFLYGLYRNVVWVVIGTRDKFCLARYEIAMRKHDCAWPFPYCNRWSWESLDEVRLINRIQTRPKVPEGVRALLPGECVTGRLDPGERAKFQVEIPNFGQQVDIFAVGDNQRPVMLDVGIGKNGGPVESYTDRDYVDKTGGGTYLISLRAPESDFKFYRLKTYWSGAGANCGPPDGWRKTYWTDHTMEKAKP